MRTVKQLLDQKGTEVWTIAPGASVFDALTLMADKNIGALVVVEGKKVVGIFSERDYARKVALEGKFSKDTPVRDIMTASERQTFEVNCLTHPVHPERCDPAGSCSIRPVWQSLQKRIDDLLAGVTLADLLREEAEVRKLPVLELAG